MNVLVTMSSTEFGHDGRADVTWVPIEEREILRDAPFAMLTEYDKPHGCEIGDGGDIYLFFCRECPGEFDSRVQSS